MLLLPASNLVTVKTQYASKMVALYIIIMFHIPQVFLQQDLDQVKPLLVP